MVKTFESTPEQLLAASRGAGGNAYIMCNVFATTNADQKELYAAIVKKLRGDPEANKSHFRVGGYDLLVDKNMSDRVLVLKVTNPNSAYGEFTDSIKGDPRLPDYSPAALVQEVCKENGWQCNMKDIGQGQAGVGGQLGGMR